MQVAFFSTREIAAGEELTWNYGVDFDTVGCVVEPCAERGDGIALLWTSSRRIGSPKEDDVRCK